MLDVMGFGALNLDLMYYVRRIAVPGKHQPIEDVFECPGGSAANTIAWLADSGFKTGFIGAVGNDREGKLMLEDFKKRKVDTKQIQVLEGHSGMIIGFVDSSGERTLYPNPGVNDKLTTDKNTIEYAKNSRILHMTSFVGDRQFREQEKLSRRISKKVKISFSPGDIYAEKGIKELMPIVERTFVMFLNQEEVKRLTGLDYLKGAEILNKLGVEIVAVTLGRRGCYISTQEEKTKVKCRKYRPVDTTGAGDAFAAGFLSGLLQDKSPKECGMLGNKLAGRCIQCKGARK
ncbi:MAG: carbohydrate kinase family protein [Candidatus Altiarchaeota archaeon]